MSPYTRRSTCSQLGCLVLTLALIALPLAGISIERPPVLTPFATEFVPLGTSLHSPPTNLLYLSSFAVPARLVLGSLPSAAFAPNADSNGRVHNIASSGFLDPGAVDSPHGRSPPSD